MDHGEAKRRFLTVDVGAYVEKHSTDIPLEELEAFLAHKKWGRRAPAELGVGEGEVKWRLHTLTERAAGQNPRPGWMRRNGSAVGPDGLVYMISTDYYPRIGSRVKIGWAKQPSKRLRELQTGCPDPLHVVCIQPGSQQIERLLHVRFDRQRVQGEWFEVDEELQDYIDKVIDEYPGCNT